MEMFSDEIIGKKIVDVNTDNNGVMPRVEIVFEDDTSLEVIGDAVFKVRNQEERNHKCEFVEQGWFGFSGKKYVCKICGKIKVGL